MNKRTNTVASRLLALTLLLPAIGIACRSEPAAVSDASFPTRIAYSIPPKELFEKVRSAVLSPQIGLTIVSQGDGRIVSDWMPEHGAEVMVAGIARHWQERTRFTITVVPSWDDPANKSSVEVTEESQQRPHDKYAWDSQDPIKRPDRASHLAQQIDNGLRDFAKKQ